MATTSFNARLDRISKKGPGTYITPGPAHELARSGPKKSPRSGKARRSWIATMLGGFFGVGAGMYYAIVLAHLMPWEIDVKAFNDMFEAEQLACGLVGLSLPLMFIGALIRRIHPGLMNFATAYLLGSIAAILI